MYNIENYISDAMRTVTPNYSSIIERFSSNDIVNLTHGVIGIETEAGELLDVVKKFLFYGKEIDFINVKEEVGDLLFYVALILKVMGASFEEVMERNIEKLSVRYPKSFNEDDARNRNLEEERRVLEKKKQNEKIQERKNELVGMIWKRKLD